MKKEKGYKKEKMWGRRIALLLVSFSVTFLTISPALAKIYLKIGITDEPKTLNPFSAFDSWSAKVITPIFQHLYIRDPDTLKLTPWIAEGQPVYDPQRKTVTFHVRSMQWDDGTAFSAEDLVFTANVFKRFRIPKHYDYWKVVDKIEALDKKTVQLRLKKPMATLFTRTLTSWVIQRKKWEPLIREADRTYEEAYQREIAKGRSEENAIKAALRRPLNLIQSQEWQPTGLGPFRFKEWRKGAYIHFVKNEYFFGMGKTISGRDLGPFFDGVIFKLYNTTDAAILALKNGDIDFFWWSVSPGYVEDLEKDPNIMIQTTLKNGYRYLAFNLRKMPMSDIAFRRAVAHLIDKDFIVERIVHNYAQRLDSVIPSGNPFYFNPRTPKYGKGMDRLERTREAFRILTTAGYRWKKPPIDSRGKLRRGKGLMMPGGEEMPTLTILTPTADYDPERAFAGQFIQEWLRNFGIPIYWKPLGFSALIQKIRKQRYFDVFVMGWGNLSLDPDYLRRFFHSRHDRPNGWNYPGYRNDEFDRLADLQAETMDLEGRRKIVLKLQEKLMNDLPLMPLFVPFNIEGIRTDRFNGWVKTLGGVGNSWTLGTLKPINN
jgi:ABC-type transport system substrate-binding protein